MRISILLEREPFGEIFEKTLSGFLKSHYGQVYNVTWRKAFSFAKANINSQTWLCNPYINAIFVEEVHRQTLLPVILEFARSEKWWRRPFQKIYVDLSTKQGTCRWFAQYIMEVSPPLMNTENLLILGGNHHIRLLDYNDGVAFIIHKDGFNKEFMNNDINVRKENPYLPCPIMKGIAEDTSWYSEELILGTPINRLGDQDQVEGAVIDVMVPLFQLYEKTARKLKVCEYASDIINRVEVHMRQNTCFDLEAIENIGRAIIALSKHINRYGTKEIFVGQTHGDFQPANILLGEKGSWLIDWEYTAERQLAYDALVFVLKARTSQHLVERMVHALNDGGECRQLLSENPFVEWHDKKYRYVSMVLFMLEELELKILENSNPLFFRSCNKFNVFLNEVQSVVQVIEGLS